MLYQLDLTNIQASRRIRIENPADLAITEKHIEDFLASHLVELVPEDQLMLIAQERKYQEEADILALDEKGKLFIFELKRWGASAENLLQVMRYGQIFGRYTYEQLEILVKKHQRLEGTLREKHQEYFGLSEALPEDRFNSDQRFVVVTNGIDRDTLEAIQYWSKKGVRIDSLTYKFYGVGGLPHVQFETFNPELELVIEENPGSFIVNTNATYMDNAWVSMLGDGKSGRASAYYDRKNAIRRIRRGSTVFLYHTGVGVIAKGKAASEYQVADYEGDPGQEYFVTLQFEWALPDKSEWKELAVKARDINSEARTSNRFRQTVFNASEMQGAIDKLRSERLPR